MNDSTSDIRGSLTSLVHLNTPSHKTQTYTEKIKTPSNSVKKIPCMKMIDLQVQEDPGECAEIILARL